VAVSDASNRYRGRRLKGAKIERGEQSALSLALALISRIPTAAMQARSGMASSAMAAALSKKEKV
jgi:hypothetical protein